MPIEAVRLFFSALVDDDDDDDMKAPDKPVV